MAFGIHTPHSPNRCDVLRVLDPLAFHARVFFRLATLLGKNLSSWFDTETAFRVDFLDAAFLMP